MDTGEGRFEMFARLKDAEEEATRRGLSLESLFSVGEEVSIKESRFRVKAIGKHYMMLVLLPKK